MNWAVRMLRVRDFDIFFWNELMTNSYQIFATATSSHFNSANFKNEGIERK